MWFPSVSFRSCLAVRAKSSWREGWGGGEGRERVANIAKIPLLFAPKSVKGKLLTDADDAGYNGTINIGKF